MPKKSIRLTSLFTLLFLFLFLAPILSPRAEAKAQEEKEFVSLLRLSRLDPVLLPAIKEGAPMVDRVGKYPIGTLISLSHTPHVKETYSQDEDALRLVPHPYLLDVTLTVKASGSLRGDYVDVSGYRLAVGSTVSFSTPTFANVGECTALSGVGDGS